MRAVRLRISMRLQLKSDRLGWCAALRQKRRASGGGTSSTRESAGRLVCYRPLDYLDYCLQALSGGARRRAARRMLSDGVRGRPCRLRSRGQRRSANRLVREAGGGSPLRRRHGVGRCRRPSSSGEVFFVGSTRAAASSSGTRSPAVRRRCLRGATRSERPQMIEKKPPTSFVRCARVASMA